MWLKKTKNFWHIYFCTLLDYNHQPFKTYKDDALLSLKETNCLNKNNRIKITTFPMKLIGHHAYLHINEYLKIFIAYIILFFFLFLLLLTDNHLLFQGLWSFRKLVNSHIHMSLFYNTIFISSSYEIIGRWSFKGHNWILIMSDQEK